jgi:pyruvate/oxaloacetate carboxyltransferase
LTRLVDTTIRLLSQDPLAGHLSTARLLNVAERLDDIGYAGLEVSGGGCFKSAVERAVESPWERIRAIKSRAPKTPLVIALRGTFLVGMKPAHPELVRRFILVAAESGIDVFRLNDPLNDVDDLAGPADARPGPSCTRAWSTATPPASSRSWSGRRSWPRSAPTGCCCTTRRERSTRRPPAS